MEQYKTTVGKVGKRKLLKDIDFEITIKRDGRRIPIVYVLPQKPRTLLDVKVPLSNNKKCMIPIFQRKMHQYIARLQTFTLP